jgi:hypothetical protein
VERAVYGAAMRAARVFNNKIPEVVVFAHECGPPPLRYCAYVLYSHDPGRDTPGVYLHGPAHSCTWLGRCSRMRVSAVEAVILVNCCMLHIASSSDACKPCTRTAASISGGLAGGLQ